MKKTLISATTFMLVLLIGACSTLSNHPISTNAADEPLWNYSKEEVVEKIAAASENYALTTSVYPFLVSYSSASVETIGGVRIPHRTEEVQFHFTEEGELYTMELEFSLGQGAVISGDKYRYTAGIIEEYNTLQEKYHNLFGDADETINISQEVPILYEQIGYIWNNVPFGDPPIQSRVDIRLKSLLLNSNYPVKTRVFTARYSRNDLSIPKMGLHEALVRNNEDRVYSLLEDGANPNSTIECRIAMDYGNYHYVQMECDALPTLYYAVRMTDVDNREEIVKALIDAGADVNAETDLYINKLEKTFADTPLAAAVGQKRIETIRLLLEAGADPEQKSEMYRGVSPIKIAESNKYTKILNILKEYQ